MLGTPADGALDSLWSVFPGLPAWAKLCRACRRFLRHAAQSHVEGKQQIPRSPTPTRAEAECVGDPGRDSSSSLMRPIFARSAKVARKSGCSSSEWHTFC